MNRADPPPPRKAILVELGLGGVARSEPDRTFLQCPKVEAEGQRIQYNFVKPHMALEGQTPVPAAALDRGVRSQLNGAQGPVASERPEDTGDIA
jgi:hypothetical protein